MKRNIVCIFAALAVLLTVACTQPAPQATSTATSPGSASPTTAAPAAKWAPTKYVTLVICTAPGSAYDTYARGITALMRKKYVDQEIVVKSVLGAGGVTGTMQVYRAKPDGYTIGLIDMEKRTADYVCTTPDFDLPKFQFIASCNRPYSSLTVAAKSTWNTVEELKKSSQVKPIRIASQDIGVVEALFPLVLDIKCTNISGMTSQEAILATIKGDADVTAFTETIVMPFAKAGEVRPIMFFADRKSKVFEDNGIKNVPYATQAGYPELASLAGMRSFVAPPGAPPEIVKFWEDAFMKTMLDPELQDWSNKVGAPIDALNSADTVKTMQGMATLYGKWKDVLKKYM